VIDVERLHSTKLKLLAWLTFFYQSAKAASAFVDKAYFLFRASLGEDFGRSWKVLFSIGGKQVEKSGILWTPHRLPLDPPLVWSSASLDSPVQELLVAGAQRASQS